MDRDYKAIRERTRAAMLGKTPDRVPLTFLTSEDVAARISGLTIREMMSSPEVLAEKTIMVNNYLGGDGMSLVVNPYCGPFEGLAYARANGREDVFV